MLLCNQAFLQLLSGKVSHCICPDVVLCYHTYTMFANSAFLLMPYNLSFAICTYISIKYFIMCIHLSSNSFVLAVFPSFIIVIFSCVPASLSKPFCVSHSYRSFVQTLAICSSPFESLSCVRVFSIPCFLLLFLFLYSSFICCHRG